MSNDQKLVMSQTSPTLHPTIFNLKRIVKKFKKERRVGLYVDLHGSFACVCVRVHVCVRECMCMSVYVCMRIFVSVG